MGTKPWNTVVYEDETEIAIIGGGVCGTLLAGRCIEQNMQCTIIERQEKLGGVWLEYANQHSALQVDCRDPVPLNWHSSVSCRRVGSY